MMTKVKLLNPVFCGCGPPPPLPPLVPLLLEDGAGEEGDNALEMEVEDMCELPGIGGR